MRARSQTTSCTSSEELLSDVLTQVLGAALLAEEVQGLHLDLAHPLACDVELAPYLLKSAGPVVLHPKPELDDLALSLGQLVERFPEVQLEERLGDGVRRRRRGGVLQEVTELRGVVVADRRLKADAPLANLLQAQDFLDRHLELARDLLVRGLAPEELDHAAVGAVELVDLLDHVDGDADRATLVRDGTRYGLPYPPRRVSGELEALAVVELLRGPDEPEVPFLDEVEERYPAVAVLLGDGDDEPQVRLDELVLAALIAAGDALGQPYLVGVGEKPHPPYLREVHPDGVAGGDGVGDLDRRRLVVLDGRGRSGRLH